MNKRCFQSKSKFSSALYQFLCERQKWGMERRERKKKTWRTFEKFPANVQCEHTFYQLSDKGLSRRTWLNFCCQTVLWSKTTPIKEERSWTYSSQKKAAAIHFWICFCSSGLLLGLDPKGLCQPKWFYDCWVLVFWYSKLPNQRMVALADWWEKCSVITLKH